MKYKTDLKYVQSLWLLGLFNNNELPQLAANLMQEGYSSDSLVKLAICAKDGTEEIRKCFEQVLIDLNMPTLSKQKALKEYGKHVLNLIIAGEIAPYDGAKNIWKTCIKHREVGDHEFDPFIYAASEMEDRPNDREFFEAAILNEARIFLNAETK